MFVKSWHGQFLENVTPDPKDTNPGFIGINLSSAYESLYWKYFFLFTNWKTIFFRTIGENQVKV